MNSASPNPGLTEAAGYFLAGLPIEDRGTSQQEIYKFIRWFGRERSFDAIIAAEVAKYAEQLSLSDTDYIRKLELIRTFLVYAKKKGWTKINLAIHLKSKKAKPRQQSSARQVSTETISLSREGHAKLKAELISLKNKRLEIIDEIRRAAADKDFRENVPLHAAREQKSHLEGRIMEVESTLKSAVIIDEKQKTTSRIGIGDSVVLCNLDSGDELSFTLVSPKEVDPAIGKISSASPIGQAIQGKEPGDIVEVVAPAGKLRYQIKQTG
ncbi:GreA/GreB family elongation factor [Chloroflexota bacterium]